MFHFAQRSAESSNMTAMVHSFLLSIQLIVLCNANEYLDSIGQPVKVLYAENMRIRGFKSIEQSDFTLGGLFPVHTSKESGGECSSKWMNQGMDFVEAFLYAVDLVNDDPEILPNITLGYDIRDTCISEYIALDEVIDLVLSSNNQQPSDCDCQNGSTKNDIPVVVGAYASFVSIPVASFLRSFKIPQISYSSTSVLLSNRDRYRYFFRTVPSDDQQAQVMIDLALYFNWTYVSTIHSNDLYGEPGIDKFRQLAKANGICIDLDEGIDDGFTSSQYETLTNKIFNSTANVIVLFASLHHVPDLFQHILDIQQTRGEERRFLWIASDAWAESQVITSKYSDIVAGMWGVLPLTEDKSGFNERFASLLPSTNKRNPWFNDYYEYYFNCTIAVTCTNSSIVDHPQYHPNSFTPLVIDAVYSVSHALNEFFNDNCDFPIKWDPSSKTCEGQQKKINGSVLRDYLQNINFTSPTGKQITFNIFGSVGSKHEISNYQTLCQNCSNEFRNVHVAQWGELDSRGIKNIRFYENVSFQFGIDSSGQPLLTYESQCQQCEIGHVKRNVQSSCCGTCSPCLGRNYTNTTTSSECSTCPDDMWGNKPLVGSDSCQDIEESYLDPSDVWAIFLIVLAFIGIVAVVLVCIAMGVFWNTPIIKSSGREQMLLLLVGIALCFVLTLVFLFKPSAIVCSLQRMGTWFCFSLILSALFVKLVRITRIFLRKQGSRRPRLIKSQYQIIFTLLLVGGQMLLVIVSLLVVYPDVTEEIILNRENTNNFPTLIYKCTSPHIALIIIQMLYYTVLLIASNALAMFTIRFPENFNEVKYVAFSTFSIGLIWLAFIPTYFATEDEFRTAIISFAIQMSALAVLVCMFGSRIFIMIVWPSKNTVKHTVQNGLTPSKHVDRAWRVQSCENLHFRTTDKEENEKRSIPVTII